MRETDVLRVAVIVSKLAELSGVPRSVIERKLNGICDDEAGYFRRLPDQVFIDLAKRRQPPCDMMLAMLLEIHAYVDHLEERCGLRAQGALPVDLEAERDVIGGILFGCGERVRAWCCGLDANDFADEVLGRLYAAANGIARSVAEGSPELRLNAWLDRLDPSDTEALDELSRQVKLGPVPSVIVDDSMAAVRRTGVIRRRATLGMRIKRDAAESTSIDWAQELVSFRGEI